MSACRTLGGRRHPQVRSAEASWQARNILTPAGLSVCLADGQVSQPPYRAGAAWRPHGAVSRSFPHPERRTKEKKKQQVLAVPSPLRYLRGGVPDDTVNVTAPWRHTENQKRPATKNGEKPPAMFSLVVHSFRARPQGLRARHPGAPRQSTRVPTDSSCVVARKCNFF